MDSQKKVSLVKERKWLNLLEDLKANSDGFNNTLMTKSWIILLSKKVSDKWLW